MSDIKNAAYSTIVNDVTIMAKLGGQPPYPGRLHESAKVTKTIAAIVMDGQTTAGSGVREDDTLTMRVQALSHDLVEAVYEDLKRLFGNAGRSQWHVLIDGTSGQAKAFVRFDSAQDAQEPDSNVAVKRVVLRLKVARPA